MYVEERHNELSRGFATREELAEERRLRVIGEVSASTEVKRRRTQLFASAAHRIGFEPDSRRLDLTALPSYLCELGCPLLVPDVTPAAVEDVAVGETISLAAEVGYFAGVGGLAISADEYSQRDSAVMLAAVTSAEFLRRGRTVVWRTAEEVCALAPRRYETTELAQEINAEFSDLCRIYELVVVNGVMVIGHTEHEERTIMKMLQERMSLFLPSLVIVAAATGVVDPEQSPIAFLLMHNFAVIREW